MGGGGVEGNAVFFVSATIKRGQGKKKKNKTFKCLAQASSMCVVVVFAQCTHIVEVKCYMFRFFRRRARETTDGSLVVYPP